MTTHVTSDEKTRQRAIDPQHSFIVQAPAGSGKTELLTQRYLRLLASAAQHPEEVIAITFTRKAAAEMRERIVDALTMAASEPEPTLAYRQYTWQLAQAVLKQDQQRQWQLLQNPNRLRILTIDALSTIICAQAPLLSGLGGQASIAENPQQHYQAAVKSILQQPEQLMSAINTLLLHLNNNADALANLLTSLLAKREQWLAHIMQYRQQPQAFKQQLEASLQALVIEKLTTVSDTFPVILQNELIELAGFTGLSIDYPLPLSNHCSAAVLNQQLQQWQKLGSMLLTKKDTWRKKVDARDGFPANTPQKAQMLALLDKLAPFSHFKNALIALTNCPPAAYQQQQWKIIEALIAVLPMLAAQLQLEFQQHAEMDFIALTLGALQALGTAEQPSELAMRLDYQIKHILLDEFQDTSLSQYHLLTQLVREWQQHDGRTLFLVGDPMQSIYRFRNAELSLFMHTQRYGIASITLESLTLTRNFRSSAAIVNWINQSFPLIFPKKSNLRLGAVPYSPCIATRENKLEQAISYHAAAPDDKQQQSVEIIALIQQLQQQYPHDTIAILTRSRRQIDTIIAQLNHQAISYQAVELEKLTQRQEIIDLVALTRALTHWGDRIAWLAILRAPWCGLTLKDLHQIAQYSDKKPILASLRHYQEIPLSNDGSKRLKRFTMVIEDGLQHASTIPLAQWVKRIWLGLDGMACLTSHNECDNINSYFELLESIQHQFSLELLQQTLEKLMATADSHSNPQLQVMTIHKAKGLEFDHVILPELQQKTRNESNELLMWLDDPDPANKHRNLILAPIKASDETADPIHHYLKSLNQQKLTLETARLFYVAVTRAKHSLHFFCRIDQQQERPPCGNFLTLIWQQYQRNFLAHYQQPSEAAAEATQPNTFNILKRLPADWQATYSFSVPNQQHYYQQALSHPQHNHAAIIGTVIHEALALAATTQQLPDTDYWQYRLRCHGMNDSDIMTALSYVKQAISQTLNDPRGQWILQAHQEANNEYRITTVENNQCQHYIIDRTFIDEQQQRWIIDYKSTQADGVDSNAFLQQQKQQHQQQLLCYAKALWKIDQRPIQLALYFPLCGAWISWQPQLQMT